MNANKYQKNSSLMELKKQTYDELTDVPEPRNLVKSLSYWNSYQYFNIWVVRS